MEEQKKKVPNKRTTEIPRKRKEIDKMEANQIPDAEFKIIVIRMHKDLRGRMDDLSENLKR